jgi:16S rRNA (guanine527-N7)-methyltransferase
VTFRDQLIRRLETVGVTVPNDDGLDKIQAYFELLTRWNRTINLTSLPLDKPTDETIDRLFTEALAAVRYLPDSATRWFDFGSGGGSPAVPMQAVASSIHLTMVESKERKAAFLREVVRNLELSATVANIRFEDVGTFDQTRNQVDVVTVRAVRPTATMFAAASAVLSQSGLLLIFQSHPHSEDIGGFRLRGITPLVESRQTFLAIYSMS